MASAITASSPHLQSVQSHSSQGQSSPHFSQSHASQPQSVHLQSVQLSLPQPSHEHAAKLATAAVAAVIDAVVDDWTFSQVPPSQQVFDAELASAQQALVPQQAASVHWPSHSQFAQSHATHSQLVQESPVQSQFSHGHSGPQQQTPSAEVRLSAEPVADTVW